MIFGGPGFISGFVVGFGTGFVSREITQLGASVVRPLTRSMVKASITAYERGRESLAQVGETFEDLVAEVRSSMMSQKVADVSASASSPAASTASASTASSALGSQLDVEEASDKEGAGEHRKKKGSHK